MRLEIKHDLQAMFNLPQKPIIFRKNCLLLIAETSFRAQLSDRCERISSPDRWKVAAIEKL